MKIKLKTIIALVVTTICLILILDLVSNTVIQTNFQNVEQIEVSQTIGNIQVAVTNTPSNLDNKVISWSQLNSTYEFIKDQNVDYQQTYLTVQSIANLGANFVIFLVMKKELLLLAWV